MNLPLVLLLVSIAAPFAIADVLRAYRAQPFDGRHFWLRERDMNSNLHKGAVQHD